TAGVHQTEREAQRQVLETVTAAWGADQLLHVWDRGFAGAGWLGEALDAGWHFVVRWKKGNHLRLATAPSVGNPAASPTAQERDGRAAWRLTAGLKAWGCATCAIRAIAARPSPSAMPRGPCGWSTATIRSGWSSCGWSTPADGGGAGSPGAC